MRRVLAAAIACLVALGPAASVEAHGVLERSEPKPGSVVAGEAAPRVVSLWFSEPVSIAATAVSVLNAAGQREDALDAHVAADDPRRVDVSLAQGPAQGAHGVRWQITAADGHVSRGSYWFAVGFADRPPPTLLEPSGAPPIPSLEVLGRWLVLAASVVLAGGAFFPLLVGRSPTPQLVWLAVAGVFLLGQVLWAAAQAMAVADVPLPGALTRDVLAAVLLRGDFAARSWSVLGLGLLLAGVLGAGNRWPWASAVLALVLLVRLAAGGHAASAPVAPQLAVLVDTLHLLAAAVWLGGLFFLLLLLRASSARAVAVLPRYSQLALISVLLVIATGLLSAWEQVGSLQALASTAYGQSLLLKVLLLLPLLALAAANLRGVGRQRVLAGLVSGELALGGTVLLAAGLLTSLPPPAQQPLPTPFFERREAGDLSVALSIDPNWVGVSRYRVDLADAAGRPAAGVRDVTLTFAMDGMNMGRTTARASPLAAGAYGLEGYYVGMPGLSQIGVGIARQDAADASVVFRVEVPDLNQRQFGGLLAAARGTPALAADLANGQAVYAAHCSVCHGVTGVGDGPAAASLLPPPSDLTLHARWHPDEQLFWFVTHGVAGTGMPAFENTLKPDERWNVIGHLHQLAEASSPTSLTTPGPEVATTPGPQLPAAPSGLTGRIVYGPDTDANLWLLTLPEGSIPPRRLTSFGTGESASSPAWSPDGRLIAFSYYRLAPGSMVPEGTDVYLAAADGSQPRLLVGHDALGAALQYPAWSPDGGSVYVSYRQQSSTQASIDKVDVHSGARQRVVDNAAFASLSPDGRRLAYTLFPTPQTRGPSLWWSAPDGSDPHQLLGPDVFLRYYGVRFGPDGERLVFAAVGQGTTFRAPSALHPWGVLGELLEPAVAHADGDLWELWTIDLAGQRLQRLTRLNEDMPVAAWSPDGQALAFLGGGSASTAETGIGVLAPDGSGLHRLTTDPGHRGLDWTR